MKRIRCTSQPLQRLRGFKYFCMNAVLLGKEAAEHPHSLSDSFKVSNSAKAKMYCLHLLLQLHYDGLTENTYPLQKTSP